MNASQHSSQKYSNINLSKNGIQDAYMNAKKQKITYEVLSTIFQTIKLKSQVNQNTEMQNQLANQNIKNGFVPPNIVPRRPEPFINPKTVYPLNKSGGFGVLYRECTIVEKGIQEKQGTNPPKFKQIVDFKNLIETEKGKNNQKLQWIKQSAQYPFRLILIDKQRKSKAIYFKTKQQAQKIRIYYISKFGLKINFAKLMQASKNKYQSKVTESLRQSLNIYNHQKKLKNQAQRVSRKSNPVDKLKGNDKQSVANKTEKLQIKYNEQDIYSQQSRPVTQTKGYNTNVMKNLIQREQLKMQQLKNNQNIKIQQLISKFQINHKKSLIQKWLIKSRYEQEARKVQDQKQSIKNTEIKSIKSKVKPVAQNSKIFLKYLSIELLNESSIFIKPIVTISLFSQNNTLEMQSKYNSVIAKKDPFLCYELILHSGSENHQLANPIENYQIGVKVIDFLSNSTICNQNIKLKNKIIKDRTTIINQNKTIRLQLFIQTQSQMSIGNQMNYQQFENNPEGSFLQVEGLSQKAILQIRQFWERHSAKRGYYSTSKDVRIIEILELYEQQPKFWALGLSQPDYKVVSILTSAQTILKFKLTQSILPILSVLQKLYSQLQQLIQVTLSILIRYMRYYYMISQLNRTNKLHTLLGLEGQIELSSKIGLQIQVMKKIISIECKQLSDQFHRKGICYAHSLYQFIYEMFSTNFKIKVLVDLWNFLFKDQAMIPVYFVLISVWLMKFYSQKLEKCTRLKQVQAIFTSKQTCSAQIIIRQIIILREKYFINSVNSNIIDSIKQIFNTKPLQQAIVDFYKRETQKLDIRKQNRHAEKKIILQKLNSQTPIELPKYNNKLYTLHIYFYKLPPVSGSLYIKANNIEYQCLNLDANCYFIISNVSTQITLQFINNKSDQYTCKLQCIQGINRHTVELSSVKDSSFYQIEYICGLLTQGHIDMLKKNRKFQHFIGPFIKQNELFDQFLRPVNECYFLNTWNKRNDKEDLSKKIKVIFSSGSKNFDQIQFYIRWIAVSNLALPEKLKLLKQFALNISKQYFLSDCKQLFKIIIFKFLSIIQFHMNSEQFRCFYSDCLDLQFKAPKLIKCRLLLPNGIQHKLQSIAVDYLSTKSSNFLFQDINLIDLLACIQKQLQHTLSSFSEGVLHIVYSTFGGIKNIQIPLIKRKTNKDIIIDQSKYQQNQKNTDITMAEPELLVTQILPTFSKISTILDFVNQSKSIESLGKNREQINNNNVQCINLLKNCDTKFNTILQMRYKMHPKLLDIPFLSYYHQIISEPGQIQLPRNIFLNNLQTDIKTICTYNGALLFGDNKKIQSAFFNKSLGLHGNLRMLPIKTESLYFSTTIPEEQIINNALMFVNYGYGTYRWQPCTVLGYYWAIKQKETNLNKQKKPKKFFVVLYEGQEKKCRDFQLRMQNEVQQGLKQIDTRSLSNKNLSSIKKFNETISSKKDVNSANQKGGIESFRSNKALSYV